jgi:hypothetical protein
LSFKIKASEENMKLCGIIIQSKTKFCLSDEKEVFAGKNGKIPEQLLV